MKQLRLKETCIQYTTTRNRYGDLKLVQTGSLPCLFRNISALTQSNFREEVQIYGIFWFDDTAVVAKGDVIGFGGQLYRLEEVIIAKTRLTYNTTSFIKCRASLYRAIS